MNHAPFTVWQGAALLDHVLDLAARITNEPGLATELATAGRALQYRYNYPRRQSERHGSAPDGQDPTRDLVRRVTWEGNGLLAVPTSEVRKWFGISFRPLADQLADYKLALVPAALPPVRVPDDQAHVVLASTVLSAGQLVTAVSRGQDPGPLLHEVRARVIVCQVGLTA